MQSLQDTGALSASSNGTGSVGEGTSQSGWREREGGREGGRERHSHIHVVDLQFPVLLYLGEGGRFSVALRVRVSASGEKRILPIDNLRESSVSSPMSCSSRGHRQFLHTFLYVCITTSFVTARDEMRLFIHLSLHEITCLFIANVTQSEL